ncbi:MAG: hypothetical protein H0W76_11790 [Pyrinomonadaceae bacterium]|nr:hypothetical protein [Pyrinomonadaceae bacterium]
MKKLLMGLVLIAMAAVALPIQAAAQQRGNRVGSVRRQQTPARTVAAVGIPKATEPVRALTGKMQGNRIAARTSDDRPIFDYVITGAQVVDGKLQFQGTINQTGRNAAPKGATPSGMASAMLVGTLSRARNPWPNASAAPPRRASTTGQAATGQPATQPQGREARNPETAGSIGQLAQSTQSTARTTQTPTAPEGRKPDGGEVTEQTQSLYTSVDTGTGCEIFFLQMQLPAHLTAASRASRPVQLGVVIAPMDNQRGEEINQHVCRIVRSLGSTPGGGQEAETQVAQLNQLLKSGH